MVGREGLCDSAALSLAALCWHRSNHACRALQTVNRHLLATGELRRTVGLLWVLASIAKGRPVAAGRQRRYKPFERSALTTPSAQRACCSGFKDLERRFVMLLMRCTGAEVGAG